MDYETRESWRSLHSIVMHQDSTVFVILTYEMNGLFACKYMQTSIAQYFWISISERSGVFDSGPGMWKPL